MPPYRGLMQNHVLWAWILIFSILYTSDEELDSIIYDEILAEAEHTADLRNCFIEADIFSVDDPERSWW